ncbi:MAG: 2Fe-2S iron-sulfur cluster-binding protein [Synoicihabitans sp.]
MSKITFVTPDGERTTVDATAENLMEVAQEHRIPGIDGDCGGVCSCSTCHVKVAAEWAGRLTAADEMELDTLSFSDQADERSRLSCQIPISDELDGLVVEVPPGD